MKNVEFVNVTKENPKKLYEQFNTFFPSTYDEFLMNHFRHPKSGKKYFFLLKKGDQIIGATTFRKGRIAGTDMEIAFAGYSYVLPEHRGGGLAKYLRSKAYLKLAKTADMIMTYGTMRDIYKNLWSKTGQAAVKRRRSQHAVYSNLEINKGPFSALKNLYQFRILKKGKIEYRDHVVIFIYYLQHIWIQLVNVLFDRTKPVECSVAKLKKLSNKEINMLNNFHTEYCRKNSKYFIERDEEFWKFLYREKEIYFIHSEKTIVGYAIASSTQDNYVIEEMYIPNKGIYLYALIYFKNQAIKQRKRALIIYPDYHHLFILKYGFVAEEPVVRIPFYSMRVTTIRPLMLFFKKIKISNGQIIIDDKFLKDQYIVGKGRDVVIKITQKEIADFISGKSIFSILRKIKLSSWGDYLKSYRIFLEVRKRYSIDNFFCTYIDHY